MCISSKLLPQMGPRLRTSALPTTRPRHLLRQSARNIISNAPVDTMEQTEIAASIRSLEAQLYQCRALPTQAATTSNALLGIIAEQIELFAAASGCNLDDETIQIRPVVSILGCFIF